MKKCSVAIVGAGISGLSFAFYCAESGLDTVVLEKDHQPGGCIRTVHYGKNRLELGAHSIFNSYGKLIEILEHQGLLERVEKREKLPFRVYEQGRIFSIMKKIRFIELFFSLPRLFTQKKAGKTVAQFYGKVLGKRNYRSLFRHFFNAVISQEADDFPADALFRKRPNRRKDVIKSFSFPGGIQEFSDTIAGKTNLEVLTGGEVTSVTQEDGGYLLKGAAEIRAEYLVLAAPSFVTANLVRSFNPDLAGRLDVLKTVEAETIGVFCRAEKVNIPLVGGLVGMDGNFYSLVSMDIAQSGDKDLRGFAFHFRKEGLSRDAKLDLVCRVLGAKREDFLEIFTKETVLPVYGPDQFLQIKEIDALIGDHSLFLTGNYLNGLSMEDCVNRSWQEFGRLRKKL